MIAPPKIFSTAKLMGGLGNQMFQIAHAVSQGLLNNVPAIFKPESYTPMQANQPTKYLDNIYKKINFYNFSVKTKTINVEWDFHPINTDWNEPIEFNGYYQSSKNFYGFDNVIRDLFKPDENFKKKIFEKYPELNFKKTCSIHVRRGDYLSISNILPTIDISYINESLKILDKQDFYFIFSDDKNWTKENIKIENSIVVEDLEDFEELWMMSLCKNNVMSNSTFSWWASFLNENSEKKVTVPSLWFGPNGIKNFSEIYEKDWIKINVSYKNGNLVCC